MANLYKWYAAVIDRYCYWPASNKYKYTCIPNLRFYPLPIR